MKSPSDPSIQTIQYYDLNAERFFQETATIDMSAIYEAFLKRIAKSGKILDAGCGSGRDSLFFSQNGFEVVALDASSEMVRRAREFTRLNVLHLNFEEIVWEEKFDGIWACASLLHLSKNNLATVILVLLRALKENGVLYFSLKEGEGEAIDNGRFFSYFKTDELKIVLKKIGSNEILDCWISSDIRPCKNDQKWINLIVKKLKSKNN